MQGSLYVIAAPSGAGKTSLVNALLKELPALQVSISHTTRAIRPGEIEGTHYFFVTRDTYEDLVKNKAFLEHAEVFGHLYGTSRVFVEEQLSQGKDVILEIDWQGARQVKLEFPQTIGIFILPPSLEVLRQRLLLRKQDAPATIEHRMKQACSEMIHYTEYDYLVINDDFQTALSELKAILIAKRLQLKNQAERNQHLISSLFNPSLSAKSEDQNNEID